MTSRSLRALACAAAAILPGIAATAAYAADPVLAPGLHPGHPEVAIVGPGIDYTNPAVAKCLARDGEGQPVAWDVIDDDQRPYGVTGADDALLLAICQMAPAAIVAVRDDPAATEGPAGAFAFLAHTRARVIVIAEPPPTAERLQLLARAAATARVPILVAAGRGSDELRRKSEEDVAQRRVGQNRVAPIDAPALLIVAPDTGAAATEIRADITVRLDGWAASPASRALTPDQRAVTAVAVAITRIMASSAAPNSLEALVGRLSGRIAPGSASAKHGTFEEARLLAQN